MLLLERMADGRYPQQGAATPICLPTGGIPASGGTHGGQADREIQVVVTNSDSSPERRATLLGLLKPGAREVVIDPGRAVVVERLSDADGVPVRPVRGRRFGRWFK